MGEHCASGAIIRKTKSDGNTSPGSSSSKLTKNEGFESPTAGPTTGPTPLTCPSECVISNPTEVCTDYNTFALYSNPDGERLLILPDENTATSLPFDGTMTCQIDDGDVQESDQFFVIWCDAANKTPETVSKCSTSLCLHQRKCSRYHPYWRDELSDESQNTHQHSRDEVGLTLQRRRQSTVVMGLL